MCYTPPAVCVFVHQDVEFLRSVMPSTTDPAFFRFLRDLDCSKVTLRSVPEGTVVFARVSIRAGGKRSQGHIVWMWSNFCYICRCLWWRWQVLWLWFNWWRPVCCAWWTMPGDKTHTYTSENNRLLWGYVVDILCVCWHTGEWNLNDKRPLKPNQIDHDVLALLLAPQTFL